MANIKLKDHYWETEGIYDAAQSKTQKAINADIAEVAQNNSDLIILSSTQPSATGNKIWIKEGVSYQIPVMDDLISNNITNNSSVTGAKVTDALNTLGSNVSDLQGSLNAILPLDTTPTSDSTKGVTSGGVRGAIDNLSSLITITPLKTFNNVVAGARKNNRIVSIDVSFQNPADGSVIGNNNVQLFSGFPIPVVNAQGWRGATLFGFIIDAPQDTTGTRTGKPVRFLVNENGVIQTYWGTSIQLQESVSISAMYFS